MRQMQNVSLRHNPFKLQVRTFHTSTILNTGLDKILNHRDTDWNNAATPFEFTEENYALIKQIVEKYPPNYQQSALAPVLDIAQRQCGGWLPLAAMNKVAKILNVPPMQVYEVATFYSMFNRTPIGKNFLQVCGTTPCHVLGALDLKAALQKRLGIKFGETTPDKKFTLLEVECLGACVNGPTMRIGDDYYEDLTVDSVLKLVDELEAGKTPKPGPQTGKRRVAEPCGKKTSLLEPPMGPYAPHLDKVDKQQAK